MSLSQEALDALNSFSFPGSKFDSEGIFPAKHNLETGENKSYRVRLLVPEGALQPFVPGLMHYWGWGSPAKKKGWCVDKNDEVQCLAEKIFFTLYDKPGYNDDKDGARYTTLKKLLHGNRAYCVLIRLDLETGQPLEDIPIEVWSMGANDSKNSANQSAFQMLQGKLKSFLTMYGGKKIPWGNSKACDVLLTFRKFRDNSMLNDVEVYSDPTTIDVSGYDFPSLEGFARQTEVTQSDIEDMLPDILGNHYTEIMADYEKYNKNSASARNGQLGEEV